MISALGARHTVNVLAVSARVILTLLALFAGCATRSRTDMKLRFLALGDSYTIGEGVNGEGRWPAQLARALRDGGMSIAEPQIIAKTGWTTSELDAAIDAAAPQGTYSMVTLLIGVNDQYRGQSVESYRPKFRALLQRAIAFAAGKAGQVIVLSIPDWGVTPFARDRDTAAIRREIDAFNQANRDEAEAFGARYVDITPETRAAGSDAAMLASDGLHPSAAMYERWVRLVLPVARVSISESDSR
jgi:lysophospholipase L1-like esterase